MKNRKYLSILALVGALMLVAAACGGDDEGETRATGGHSPRAGLSTARPIEFGCVEIAAGAPIQLASLLSITGETAFLGTDSNHGIELAIDYLDEAFDADAGATPRPRRRASFRRTTAVPPRVGRPGATALAANPGHRRRHRDDVLELGARRRRHDPRRQGDPAVLAVEHEPGPHVGGGAPALLRAHRAQRQDPGRDRGRVRRSTSSAPRRPRRSTTRARTPTVSRQRSATTSRRSVARSPRSSR